MMAGGNALGDKILILLFETVLVAIGVAVAASAVAKIWKRLEHVNT